MQAARVRKLLGLKFVPKPKPKINTEDSIDVLGWLIDTANIVQNASSVCAFPQIQYAVAALSVLLQCVQRVRKNNDDYEELLSRVKIILEALRRVVDDSDEEMCSRMNTVFLEFHTSLREIVREVNSQRKSNDKWIKQFLHSHGVSQAIDQLRMKFDDLRLNVLVTASFAHHSSMKEQFSKLDQKLDVEIESQAVVAVETQASLSNLQYQSQTLHGEAQKQTRLMGQHQTELITAFAMQGQRMRENLRGQDMLATQHHIQTTNNLRDHQSWLQSTLHDQTQLALRQHGEVLEAVKQVVSPPSTSSDDELEEYEENFQVFKQSQWKPKRTIRSSDEEEGSWMSTDPQVLVIDQTSIVGNVKYRVRTFKAAEHNKPEHKDAAFRAFKEHLHLHSSTR
ncbi:hypothetical protein BT96DRAFT_80074 [Gymnopus androsaceus JB14]|uniref:Uncharacterized protein n=1 Tax=Gymnopus androsaceus JB14 TaxID=1447944 RepID=A0A6A4HJA7_9AGAR|nr:hypothetical protein BT96DRAFT_80074 [Gymnopus androsaceus JB14]